MGPCTRLMLAKLKQRQAHALLLKKRISGDHYSIVMVTENKRAQFVRILDRDRHMIPQTNKFREITANHRHSLAIRDDDGSIVCWGDNDYGQAPPGGVGGDFVAIAAGGQHSLAIRRDGSVHCFGDNEHGQAPPEGVNGEFVAIAAGGQHSLAIRRDGGVACWGRNHHGQAPPGGVPGDFVAIAAGGHHSLALRRDGSVACWGKNDDNQAPPAGVDGVFVAIAAGSDFSVALNINGSVVCWGNDVPEILPGKFVSIVVDCGIRHAIFAITSTGEVACLSALFFWESGIWEDQRVYVGEV